MVVLSVKLSLLVLKLPTFTSALEFLKGLLRLRQMSFYLLKDSGKPISCA